MFFLDSYCFKEIRENQRFNYNVFFPGSLQLGIRVWKFQVEDYFNIQVLLFFAYKHMQIRLFPSCWIHTLQQFIGFICSKNYSGSYLTLKNEGKQRDALPEVALGEN